MCSGNPCLYFGIYLQEELNKSISVPEIKRNYFEVFSSLHEGRGVQLFFCLVALVNEEIFILFYKPL